MSNSNTNLQTQSSNALHNAIMEAGSKDRPPMLAPDSFLFASLPHCWKTSRTSSLPLVAPRSSSRVTRTPH
ncbi:hypothetical protein Tco_1348031 [Tanacetum coccineum]